ncbi:retrovirus-related pol polyprotein from transposon TNT 1-94, partial [Tanacetum coccineum]
MIWVRNYMEQPEGFQVKGKEDYVCRLQKSLYGLKQAPRQWYKKFESVIGKQGFRKTFSDHCVFFQRFGDDDFIILLLYVDDMLIVGKNFHYTIGPCGGAVSWQSRLQKCVALSTTEAEYVAATEAYKELLWLKRFLQELGFKQQRYAVLCDNQSPIYLTKNSMFHKRTKHIDIRYHWIRDAIED